MSIDGAALRQTLLARIEAVTAQVEQARIEATGMSAAAFGVLVRMHEAGGVKFQHELQRDLHWSVTRYSRELARTARRRLIERRPTGRGKPVELRLTLDGGEALLAARGPRGAAMRRFFLHVLF